MKKIWNVQIRPKIKREFPKDPMMQELHEIRVRLSKKYKPVKQGWISELFSRLKKN